MLLSTARIRSVTTDRREGRDRVAVRVGLAARDGAAAQVGREGQVGLASPASACPVAVSASGNPSASRDVVYEEAEGLHKVLTPWT